MSSIIRSTLLSLVVLLVGFSGVAQASDAGKAMTIKGTVADTNAQTSTVTIKVPGKKDDKTYVLTVDAQSAITIDKNKAQLTDLKAGDSVSATYKDHVISVLAVTRTGDTKKK